MRAFGSYIYQNSHLLRLLGVAEAGGEKSMIEICYFDLIL